MPDRFASLALLGALVHGCVMEPLERRPIGTNGYVSTWGAIAGICPPKDC
ncbi:hypothetical protein N566_19285 [Streptomycetaceae bacterium MP113-05]|nr:hypothetical protein N566_19285 [Streptomycetaceae bacterium MP113-05]